MDDLILEGMQSDSDLNADTGVQFNLSPRNAAGNDLRSFFICQIC